LARAVFSFVSYLNNIEIGEIDSFLVHYAAEDYRAINGSGKFVSYEMAESFLPSVKRAFHRYAQYVRNSVAENPESDHAVKRITEVERERREAIVYFNHLVNNQLVTGVDQMSSPFCS